MSRDTLRHNSTGAAAAAALGAGGLVMAFPPFNWLGGWWAIPALSLLLWALRGVSVRAGAALGFGAGLVFFGGLLRWISVLGPDAWIALTLLCATFWAGAGALLPRLLDSRWAVLAVPGLWIGMEALRAVVPWGGFPWGQMGQSQSTTALGGLAVLAGSPLVSAAVVAAAVLLLELVAPGPTGRRLPRWLPVAAGLSLFGLSAGVSALSWGGPTQTTSPIAVVQGNVPRAGLDFNAQRRAVLDNHVAETMRLAADVAAGRQPQPVAVIWPENSSDIDPRANPDAAALIQQAAATIGAPILVGAVVANPDDPPLGDHPGTVLNVGLVWDPVTGPGQFYAKRHPVPFGEYLPMRGLLSRFITRFDRIPRDFAAGPVPGVLDLGGVPAGLVICFEVAYDSLPRDAVREGGQVLVVQTNNATYARTGQPEQQLAITILRARETGREVLVAATSGISAVITPRGELTWAAPEMVAATTVAQVPLRTGLTPAVRLGWLTSALAAGAGLAAVGAWVRARPYGAAEDQLPDLQQTG